MSVSRAYLGRKLSRPLPTKDGTTLRTVAYARAYMVALPRAAGTWSYCAADAAGLREALCQTAEEFDWHKADVVK